MGFIIGIILFGIPSAIIAKKKGFKALRWLIAFGLIGLIVVACLTSAKTPGLSEEFAIQNAEKANKVGAWMAGLNIAIGVISTLIFIANS
jgi:hypothetical protein